MQCSKLWEEAADELCIKITNVKIKEIQSLFEKEEIKLFEIEFTYEDVVSTNWLFAVSNQYHNLFFEDPYCQNAVFVRSLSKKEISFTINQFINSERSVLYFNEKRKKIWRKEIPKASKNISMFCEHVKDWIEAFNRF